jgi:hypothetical protein
MVFEFIGAKMPLARGKLGNERKRKLKKVGVGG